MNTEAVSDQLKTHLASILATPVAGIDVDKSLRDLGLDSFGFTELVAGIEARYGFTFSEDELMSSKLDRISSIAKAVHDKLAARQ